MGYTLEALILPHDAKLSSHNSAQDELDRETKECFEREVAMLIESDRDYKRVVVW